LFPYQDFVEPSQKFLVQGERSQLTRTAKAGKDANTLACDFGPGIDVFIRGAVKFPSTFAVGATHA